MKHNGMRTFCSCPRSLGVSFSQALSAILPSDGSSEVIVFNAGIKERSLWHARNLTGRQGLLYPRHPEHC